MDMSEYELMDKSVLLSDRALNWQVIRIKQIAASCIN